MIFCNGELLAQGSQFSLNDVEVVTATVDIEAVRSYRFAPSRGLQSLSSPAYKRIEADFSLGNSDNDFDVSIVPTQPRQLKIHAAEEEISLSAACYCWDYLRRSGQAGYLIPLSGGLDSCSTAVLIYSMCREVAKALGQGNKQVQMDVNRFSPLEGGEDWKPESASALCGQLLSSVYMGMEKNSSPETRERAQQLATFLGSNHVDMNIDKMVTAFESTFLEATGFQPKFKSDGGSLTEDLALQNIQSRTRMVTAYLFAQLLPTALKKPRRGNLLVLGSANVKSSVTTKIQLADFDYSRLTSVCAG
jgi:NAD+ synthase (glutamine-hydrolysing)